jgi:hypothetical protein
MIKPGGDEMRTWYVEVTRRTTRFGYVRAATRREAIKLATDFDGDRDGLTTRITPWETTIAEEYKQKQDVDADASEILTTAFDTDTAPC